MSYIIERAEQALADYDAWAATPLADRTKADPAGVKVAEFAGGFSVLLRAVVELHKQPAPGRHARTGTGWV
jgi:hypothetical protein